MEKLKCIICDAVGQWENVDRYRFKPQNMCMCTKCGFVTYPNAYLDLDKVKNHYTHEYRQAPTVNNIFSSERKLHYHINFLDNLFKDWQKQKKEPVVLEIGSAIGLFLNWIKTQFPKSEIYGTELTESFVRAAYWLYQLKLLPEADFNKKYDLIASYKVAEHIPNIDQELLKYQQSLKDDGFLYISVPTWFGKLYNFGMSGFSLEYYYDPNHLNVWSRSQFESLLNKSGFEIVTENHTFYDQTYLCKKNDDMKLKPVVIDDPVKRREDLQKIYEAGKLYEEQNYSKAIEIWPNFPSAHIGKYEMNRGKADKEGWESIQKNFLDPILSSCPDDFHALAFVGDINMRYNKWDRGIEFFQKALEVRPMDATALLGISHCLRNKALKAESMADKIKLHREALAICGLIENNSMQNRYEAITWILQDASQIPTPFEEKYKGLWEEIEKGNKR